METDPRLQDPVEIEQGRRIFESMNKTVEVVETCIQGFTQLEGTSTLGRYLDMLNIMCGVGKSESFARNTVTSEKTSHFYSFHSLNDQPIEVASDAQIELSAVQVKERTGIFETLIEECGIDMSAEDFVTSWITAHELGHGFSAAFSNVAPRSLPKGFFKWTTYQRLEDRIVEQKIVNPIIVDDKAELKIESERFAEGFARLIIRALLQIDDSHPIMKKLQEYREMRYKEGDDDDPEWKRTMIGYSVPYDATEMEQIFIAISELEVTRQTVMQEA